MDNIDSFKFTPNFKEKVKKEKNKEQKRYIFSPIVESPPIRPVYRRVNNNVRYVRVVDCEANDE